MLKANTRSLQFIPIILIFIFVTLSGRAAPDISPPHETNGPNFYLVRSVSGAGGIQSAGAQYFHSATAGEIIVGASNNANQIVIAGYWAPVLWENISAIDSPGPVVPASFMLHQNYPNPFNPHTVIEYELPCKCRVEIDIYNSVGQRIRRLVSGIEGPGYYQVIWNALDDRSGVIGTGLYFYHINAVALVNIGQDIRTFQQTKKMILIK